MSQAGSSSKASHPESVHFITSLELVYRKYKISNDENILISHCEALDLPLSTRSVIGLLSFLLNFELILGSRKIFLEKSYEMAKIEQKRAFKYCGGYGKTIYSCPPELQTFENYKNVLMQEFTNLNIRTIFKNYINFQETTQKQKAQNRITNQQNKNMHKILKQATHSVFLYNFLMELIQRENYKLGIYRFLPNFLQVYNLGVNNLEKIDDLVDLLICKIILFSKPINFRKYKFELESGGFLKDEEQSMEKESGKIQTETEDEEDGDSLLRMASRKKVECIREDIEKFKKNYWG